MTRLWLLAATVLLASCGGDKGNQATADNQPLAPVGAPNGGDWTRTVSQTAEGGMLMGNPNAKVKLVEFSSLTCPHCAHFAENGAPKLIADYVKSGQVSFEFRNFVRDPLDIAMALIARCNGAGPQFFALSDALFKEQKAIFERVQATPPAELQALADLPPAQQFGRYAALAGLPVIAARNGLPTNKSAQCLADQGATERLVAMNSDASSTYDIKGTPTFLINNKVVDLGSISEDKVWDALEQKIRAALT